MASSNISAAELECIINERDWGKPEPTSPRGVRQLATSEEKSSWQRPGGEQAI